MARKALWLTIIGCVLFLTGTLHAQGPVRAVVVNEFANIRIIPAIGADVIATVPSGYAFNIVNARSPDNEWLRVDFNGNEGWVHVATLTILDGSVAALPVADPRTIPYGGFESPRSGSTRATSNIRAQLPTTGVHVRAGPSVGYPIIAEALRYDEFEVFGRTASNGWIQVKFRDTLGWIASQYVLVTVPIPDLPIDGIVADAPPLSGTGSENLIATLRLLLARLDLAQPSLDRIRASWTDSALTGRASCQPYPPQPSDFNIANDLLAAYYPTLYPIITLFNDAMFNVRKSIDLFIEVCNQPGTGNPVGQATVIGALGIVALADSQFADLRGQISALIPTDRELGPDECLFAFGGEADILPVIRVGQIIIDNFNPRRRATGYCIDLNVGETINIETLQRPNSNVVHRLSISPFDNPTNFVAVGNGSADTGRLLVGPIPIQETQRYLIVLSQATPLEELLNGEFGLLVSFAGGIAGSQLALDQSGQIVLGTPDLFGGAVTPLPGGGPPFATQQTGPFLPPTSGPPINRPDGFGNVSPIGAGAVCTNIAATCEQIASCEEAYACLNAGNFNLDPDADGIPCEILRCPSG